MSKDTIIIAQNFEKDKIFLAEIREKYLVDNKARPKTEENKSIDSLSNEIAEEMNKGNLNVALIKLEELRDLRSGIIRTIKYDNNKKGEQATPVLIRDARNCQPVLGTESFEMQYLNVLRAGINIAVSENSKPLETALISMTNNFARKIKEQGLDKPILEQDEKKREKAEKERQVKLANLVKAEKSNIAEIMNKSYAIADASKKLDKVQNYQNFNDKPANIVTIKDIFDRESVESEVGFRELTPAQKKEYQNIIDGKDQPIWFNKLPKWEQKLLTEQYAKIIIEGKHVIPTQLIHIAGMRNAFEKTTQIVENEGPQAGHLKTLHVAKHAGTLMANNKEVGQEMTDENARQAQAWFGEKKLHCNTFNAGVIGAGLDPKIVAMTTKAMKNVGGKETNTSFNKFRLFGIANDYTGVKDTLKNIAETNDKLKAHLIPRSRFDRLLGLNKPKNNIEAILANIKEPEATIYRKAIDLRKAVEQADVPFRLFGDKNNINLTISTKLNILNNIINNSPSSNLNLPKEEILNMCKSGKDRTGLSMHDQTAHVIAAELKIDIKDVDRELLKNGHIAQQAGSISAGGGTIGCYGTKGENKAGIPKSRMKNLVSIIEKSASGNKIKGKDSPVNNKELINAKIANKFANEAAVNMEYKSNQLANNQKKNPSIFIDSKFSPPTQSIRRKTQINSRNV